MKKRFLLFAIVLIALLSAPAIAGPLTPAPDNCSSYTRNVVIGGVFMGQCTYSWSMRYY